VARRQFAGKIDFCRSRFGHGPVPHAAHGIAKNRLPELSFLWSVIRDPTQRAISQFFHFEVSRKHVPPTDAHFQRFLLQNRPNNPLLLQDYYYKTLYSESRFNRAFGDDPIVTANHILSEYNFIGVTERMDESAVVLMMLLDLPMSDV